MNKITLSQLLQYNKDEDEQDKNIQVVMYGRDWETADEVRMDSELLYPFLDYIITDMAFHKPFNGKDPVLRVSIRPPQQKNNCNAVLCIDNVVYAFNGKRVC